MNAATTRRTTSLRSAGTPPSPKFATGAVALAALNLIALSWLPGCGTTPSGPPTSGQGALELGEKHKGQYHLGPVDFSETEYHNACAPGGGYRSELRAAVGLSGEYLAGVSNELSAGGGICDSCMRIETATGESIIARIVTYGVEQASGDIDVSPSVFDAIHQGEYPRSMEWSLVACPPSGNIQLEYKADSNPWWTALWVRNSRIPLKQLAVAVGSEGTLHDLKMESDGSWVLDSGFGDGKFTLIITSALGDELRKDFASFASGAILDSGINFDE
jgi:hypothetical protein